MKKNTLQAKVTNRYNENGATITQLIQTWMNEKNFFENLNILYKEDKCNN